MTLKGTCHPDWEWKHAACPMLVYDAGGDTGIVVAGKKGTQILFNMR